MVDLWVVRETSNDVKILLANVLLRRGSFGLTNQVLTLFLRLVGISNSSIGIFMTLTLVGDTAISYVLTWFSDDIGRRAVMCVGAVLMLISGVIFAVSLNFWVLLGAAIAGVISTSGDETGPFKTIEEVCLSHLTPPKYRAPVFAIYGFLGRLGAALGSVLCGFLVDFWCYRQGWALEKCYRAVFVIYSAVALVKFALSVCLTSACELDEELRGQAAEIDQVDAEVDGASESVTEESGLLDPDAVEEPLRDTSPGSKGFTSKTREVLPTLLVAFMLDSFGYGFMPPAWIVYYFKTVFHTGASALGSLFFFTNLVDSLSSVVLAVTFSHLGPVKAILAAQLPSAAFFSSIAACTSFAPAAVFYFLFCATGTMDVVPRQVLLTTIIPKEDLLKVMGTVNIAKTFANSVGPIFSGNLAQHGLLYLGFIINGVCLLLADTLLGIRFAHLDSKVLAVHL